MTCSRGLKDLIYTSKENVFLFLKPRKYYVGTTYAIPFYLENQFVLCCISAVFKFKFCMTVIPCFSQLYFVHFGFLYIWSLILELL